MTKHTRLILILAVVICGGFLLRVKLTPEPEAEKPVVAHEVDLKNLRIDGKKVVGLPPGEEEEQIRNLQVTNRVSPEWREKLESALRLQGGSEVKELLIDKVDSFIWAHGGIALNVESVIVRLKNLKDEQTSFRVLVDAQTGKILKNWDQPVIDPANPRDAFRIKVDPSYHTN